jgi:chemotaxis signal transduction protein
LSTRTIVAEASGARLIGLLAEKVSDTRTVEPEAAAGRDSGALEASYLGPVLRLDRELVQLLDVDGLAGSLVREDSARQGAASV